jgi:hypothetical protein
MTAGTVYETPRGDLAVDVDGIRYFVEDLDEDRLVANLVDVDERLTTLRLMEERDEKPGRQHWKHQADLAAVKAEELRMLIRAKRNAEL